MCQIHCIIITYAVINRRLSCIISSNALMYFILLYNMFVSLQVLSGFMAIPEFQVKFLSYPTETLLKLAVCIILIVLIHDQIQLHLSSVIRFSFLT